MDDTSTYIDTSNQKPSRKKTIWLVLIILALIASNVGWALFYLKQQGELNTKISILTAQNLKLTKDNKNLQNADSKTEDTSDYREIPELGVKYKLDDTTKDLTYIFEKIGNERFSAYFSTTSITKADENLDAARGYECASDSGIAGSFARYTSKDLNDNEVLTGTTIQKLLDKKSPDVKKIGNYYFVYSLPNGNTVCDKNDREKSQAISKKAFESLVQI